MFIHVVFGLVSVQAERWTSTGGVSFRFKPHELPLQNTDRTDPGFGWRSAQRDDVSELPRWCIAMDCTKTLEAQGKHMPYRNTVFSCFLIVRCFRMPRKHEITCFTVLHVRLVVIFVGIGATDVCRPKFFNVHDNWRSYDHLQSQ